jgi:transcription elongation factor Elf1
MKYCTLRRNFFRALLAIPIAMAHSQVEKCPTNLRCIHCGAFKWKAEDVDEGQMLLSCQVCGDPFHIEWEE